ncbi:LapA family protein [Nocardioides nanhaiensis]|uniref:DUF1049 domain-containing protein n=1 Tax=Nocardioides nanhaiensis TaxID=1476871 RepID=A0ABP8VQY7_9ACTN
MSQSTPTPSPADPTGTPAGSTAAATEPGSKAAPTPAPSSRRGAAEKDPLRGSRTGGIYAALIAFGLVLILLVIFIAQNTESVPVRFLGWEGSAPLAVSLLIAVAAGLLLAGAAASARIVQLRRRVKHERKHA